MAYRVVVNGLTIECDTVEEVKALAGLDIDAGGKESEKAELFTPAPAGRNDHSAVRLLKVLVDNEEHGVQVETLVRTLGLKGVRGMGPFTTAVKTQLAKIGMNDTDVMRIVRTSEGRRYFADARAREALKKFAAAGDQ